MSWQDRTINMEFMIHPVRSQLVYNKHKGLKTKCEQESYSLDKEKESYLRSFKTEQRLMERRKDRYSKRRNDIILRRASDDRKRSSQAGRISAPPRLEQGYLTDSKTDMTFVTEVPERVTKSAGARATFTERTSSAHRRTPDITNTITSATDDSRTMYPVVSTRVPTPGKPYILREKSVRFQNMQIVNHNTTTDKVHAQVPVQERIKKFLVAQADFNTRGPTLVTDHDLEIPDGRVPTSSKPPSARRISGMNLNLIKLESAFNVFCTDSSSDGLHKLVSYASRMKASERIARNSAMQSHTMQSIYSTGEK